MRIDFKDKYSIQRWRYLNGPTRRILQPKIDGNFSKRRISFLATPALVATMLSAGIPVHSHPLYRDQYVVLDRLISDITLRDLVTNQDFVFLAAVFFLGSPTGSLQTFTSDATWNNSNNTIEIVGSGGSGGAAGGAAGDTAAGGAGAGYALISNFVFATPGTTTAQWEIATPGAAVTRGTSGGTAGNSATASWFNAAADPGNGTTNAKCSAAGGGGGGVNTASGGATGGAAGATTTFWGQTKNIGGNGGSTVAGTSGQAAGGGGAGGPSGIGTAAANTTNTALSVTSGGAADNGTVTGGSGASGAGSATASAGNSGNEWPSGGGFVTSGGSGAGGGGAASSGGNATGGNGGNYGGGGGGALCNPVSFTLTSGAGTQGIIVLTWQPTFTMGILT